MRRRIPECPPLPQEDDVRDEFSAFEKANAAGFCVRCKHESRLVRVNEIGYFHNATDDLGGLVPCKARTSYQEAARKNPR